ncbi:MAG: twin-arginine translocation signal domain-containing protein [Candidatus Peribacteraceae bacterium]|jgi:hypothetical protein|nr:twin-arginine translocation signal domain-containing protein [Candidatus Peribacteraceae bacterium]
MSTNPETSEAQQENPTLAELNSAASPAGTEPLQPETADGDSGILVETTNASVTQEATTQKGILRRILGIGRNVGKSIRRAVLPNREERASMSESEKLTRRRFLQIGGGTAAAATLGGVGYSLWPKGGRGFSARETESKVENIDEGRPDFIPLDEWRNTLTPAQRDAIRKHSQEMAKKGSMSSTGRAKVPEAHKPEQGTVREGLENLNSFWGVAPVPAAEIAGWIANAIVSELAIHQKHLKLTREITDPGSPDMSKNKRYTAINLPAHSVKQLRELRDEINATKEAVEAMGERVDNGERAIRLVIQTILVLLGTGAKLSGILTSQGLKTAVGIGAAFGINRLRPENISQAVAQRVIKDLDRHLTRVKDALDDAIKAAATAPAAAPVPSPAPIAPQAPPSPLPPASPSSPASNP